MLYMFDCRVTIWSSLLWDWGMNSCGVPVWLISPYLLILTHLGSLLDPTLKMGVSNPLHTFGVHTEETFLLIGCIKAGVEKFFPYQTGYSLQHLSSLCLILTSRGLHLYSITASPCMLGTRVLPFLSWIISRLALRRAWDVMMSCYAISHAR